VHKIYVSLTDDTDQSKPHKAQGTLVVKDADFTNGLATVTMNLYNATAPDSDPDDQSNGIFSGTASAFQITICPASAPNSASIEAKGNYGFNGTADWNSMIGVDIIPGSKKAIYNRIICNDKDTAGGGTGTGISGTNKET
jgi:hypothetical protein